MTKTDPHEERVAAAHRAELKAAYEAAKAHGKGEFFLKLLAYNLTPAEISRAVTLAPRDSDAAATEKTAKAAAFVIATDAKQRERAEAQRAEDEKARAAAEKRWAELHGAPTTIDFRTGAERQLHGNFAALAKAATPARDFEAERDLMQAGAAAARKLWRGGPQDPEIELRRAAAEQRNMKG